MYNFFRGRCVIGGILRSRWWRRKRLLTGLLPGGVRSAHCTVSLEMGCGLKTTPWPMIHHGMSPRKTCGQPLSPSAVSQSGNSTRASAKKCPCSLRLHQFLPVSTRAAWMRLGGLPGNLLRIFHVSDACEKQETVFPSHSTMDKMKISCWMSNWGLFLSS